MDDWGVSDGVTSNPTNHALLAISVLASMLALPEGTILVGICSCVVGLGFTFSLMVEAEFIIYVDFTCKCSRRKHPSKYYADYPANFKFTQYHHFPLSIDR